MNGEAEGGGKDGQERRSSLLARMHQEWIEAGISTKLKAASLR